MARFVVEVFFVLVFSATNAAHEEVIDVILASLAKSASFLEQEHRNINLDGVVGYTILQGEYVAVGGKNNGTPCIVTKSCRDTMTRFGCPNYSLSHQLLYFMLGANRGCSAMLKGDMRPSRANLTERQYQGIFCSNMLKGNMDIIQKNFTGETQDIFIENILLCGLAGFSDFPFTVLPPLLPPDGCSSHITGVSVSALGGYLNYYLTEQDITKRPLT
eukprot:XP_014041104.1 PREDICTED: UPF0764 protein C16orf89 homolog [Salmo salar]